jgi:hypothetical protein
LFVLAKYVSIDLVLSVNLGVDDPLLLLLLDAVGSKSIETEFVLEDDLDDDLDDENNDDENIFVDDVDDTQLFVDEDDGRDRIQHDRFNVFRLEEE